MKIFFKMITTVFIAGFLTVCSNDKEETKAVEVAKEQAVKKTAPVKLNPQFEKMLKHVPADTPYLFANKNSIDSKVRQFHLQRMQQYLSLFNNSFEAKVVRGDPEFDKERERASKFFNLLISKLSSQEKDNSIAGLKADAHNILYGYQSFPVLRLELTGDGELIKHIKSAQKESQYDLPMTKCGEYDCFTQTKGQSGYTLLFMEDQLVVSIYHVDNQDEIMQHMMGKNLPELSYKASDWDVFLAANHFKGYGDGFINLNDLYSIIEKRYFTTLENSVADTITDDMKSVLADEMRSTLAGQKACSAVAKKHFENMPRLVFGITKLDAKQLNYEAILKTNATITTALKAIPNTLVDYQVAQSPIVDFGLNLNFSKLKDALSTYAQFLIAANTNSECDVIKAGAIRKAMGGLSMASMFGADQFKSIYLAANNIDFNDHGELDKIAIFAAVGADNPNSLVQMLAMLNPQFANLKLPKDGAAIQVPAELLQNPRVPAKIPDTFISSKGKRLNIMVGDKTPSLKVLNTDAPTLLWSSIEGTRYYDVMMKIMKKAAKSQGDKAIDEQLEVINKMKNLIGKVSQKLIVDDRGLVWQSESDFSEVK